MIVRIPYSDFVFCTTASSPPPDMRVSSGLLANMTWSLEFFTSSSELDGIQPP